MLITTLTGRRRAASPAPAPAPAPVPAPRPEPTTHVERSFRIDYGGTLHPDKASASDSAAAFRAALAEQRQRHANNQTPIRLNFDKPVGGSNRAFLFADTLPAGAFDSIGVFAPTIDVLDSACSGMQFVLDGVDLHADPTGAQARWLAVGGRQNRGLRQFTLECGGGTDPYNPTRPLNSRAYELPTQPTFSAPIPAGGNLITLGTTAGLAVGQWGALCWGECLQGSAIGNSQPFVHFAKITGISGNDITFDPPLTKEAWQIPYRDGTAMKGTATWGNAPPVRWQNLDGVMLENFQIIGRNNSSIQAWTPEVLMYGSTMVDILYRGESNTDRLKFYNHNACHWQSSFTHASSPSVEAGWKWIDYIGTYTSIPSKRNGSGLWPLSFDQGCKDAGMRSCSIETPGADVTHVHEDSSIYINDLDYVDTGVVGFSAQAVVTGSAYPGGMKITQSTFNSGSDRTTILFKADGSGSCELYDVDLVDGRVSYAATSAKSDGFVNPYSAECLYNDVRSTGSVWFGGSGEQIDVGAGNWTP